MRHRRSFAAAGFQTRMAAALCGLHGSDSKPTRAAREPRRKVKDSRRRQAALLFLNNISLDGRPLCQLNVNDDRNAAEEPRLGDRDGCAAAERLNEGAGTQQVTQTSAAANSSSSSLPGVLSPVRPSMVTSPGPTATGSIGPNEVFLESGGAVETLTLADTPLSPVPAGHQPCSRAKSTPAPLSPVPTGNPLDSRPR